MVTTPVPPMPVHEDAIGLGTRSTAASAPPASPAPAQRRQSSRPCCLRATTLPCFSVPPSTVTKAGQSALDGRSGRCCRTGLVDGCVLRPIGGVHRFHDREAVGLHASSHRSPRTPAWSMTRPWWSAIGEGCRACGRRRFSAAHCLVVDEHRDAGDGAQLAPVPGSMLVPVLHGDAIGAQGVPPLYFSGSSAHQRDDDLLDAFGHETWWLIVQGPARRPVVRPARPSWRPRRCRGSCRSWTLLDDDRRACIGELARNGRYVPSPRFWNMCGVSTNGDMAPIHVRALTTHLRERLGELAAVAVADHVDQRVAADADADRQRSVRYHRG